MFSRHRGIIITLVGGSIVVGLVRLIAPGRSFILWAGVDGAVLVISRNNPWGPFLEVILNKSHLHICASSVG